MMTFQVAALDACRAFSASHWTLSRLTACARTNHLHRTGTVTACDVVSQASGAAMVTRCRSFHAVLAETVTARARESHVISSAVVTRRRDFHEVTAVTVTCSRGTFHRVDAVIRTRPRSRQATGLLVTTWVSVAPAFHRT